MDPEKFSKVLALADSDHHGEAQSALRAARIMLARVGLTFRDLAMLARETKGRLNLPEPEPPPAPSVPLGQFGGSGSGFGDESLRRQLREMQSKIQELEFALTRQRAETVRQRHEAKRWHKLAQDTAEKLWDMGQVLETHHHSRRDPADRRRLLLEMLRDPASAEWSNREISRRTGTAPQAVSYWRWRLALAERLRHQTKTLPRGRRLVARLTEIATRGHGHGHHLR